MRHKDLIFPICDDFFNGRVSFCKDYVVWNSWFAHGTICCGVLIEDGHPLRMTLHAVESVEMTFSLEADVEQH